MISVIFLLFKSQLRVRPWLMEQWMMHLSLEPEVHGSIPGSGAILYFAWIRLNCVKITEKPSLWG